MKTYEVFIQTNVVGSKCSIEFDVEDDLTEEEIEEIAKEALWGSGIAEWWYEEKGGLHEI